MNLTNKARWEAIVESANFIERCCDDISNGKIKTSMGMEVSFKIIKKEANEIKKLVRSVIGNQND